MKENLYLYLYGKLASDVGAAILSKESSLYKEAGIRDFFGRIFRRGKNLPGSAGSTETELKKLKYQLNKIKKERDYTVNELNKKMENLVSGYEEELSNLKNQYYKELNEKMENLAYGYEKELSDIRNQLSNWKMGLGLGLPAVGLAGYGIGRTTS